jgi:hypothetical protein
VCRIISSIRTMDQHFQALDSNPSIYHPEYCDQCGRSGLWGHGVYHRKGDRSITGSYRYTAIPIPRFLCPHCGVTCSRLPACLAPRRWYPWGTQALAIFLVITGHSLVCATDLCGAVPCTVRRWQRWLQERSVELSFHLRSLFPSLGRYGEDDAFWSSSLRSMSFADAMAAVCHQGVAVP